MGKSKYLCTKCGQKHYPPTGKKCSHSIATLSDPKDSVVVSKGKKKQTGKSHVSEEGELNSISNSCGSLLSAAAALDASGQESSESASETSSEEESSQQASSDVQLQILKELQRVNSQLDAVEEKVATGHKQTAVLGQKKAKLSTLKYQSGKKRSKKVVVTSDSSSDESDIPDISSLRSSRQLQMRVDQRLSKLEENSRTKGNCTSKIKSKRGGDVEVFVEKKVAWPHEAILGGASRQRISYDQLSLTQFVQGFVRNILDEADGKCREHMLTYLSELMEDATDFTWSNAKASHAVLLCEMERGVLDWSHTSRIERIRRAHAQKHHQSQKSNWAKQENNKKPWYCKLFQSGNCMYSRDHEHGGKMYRHICVHCLALGKQLNHPGKECNANKKLGTKNE